MQKQQQISKKYLFALLLYGVAAFFVFFIVLLPKEKIINRALHQVFEQIHCKFTAQDVYIGFPGHLELKNVKISGKHTDAEPPPYLQIDKIYIKPKLSQLFLKKIGIFFNLHFYKGNLDGKAHFDLFHPGNLQDIHCLVKEIQLGEIKQIGELFNTHISGKLSGEAKIKLTQNNLMKSEGDYTFTITPGNAQIMNFPSFTFQEIHGHGNVNQGKVKIKSIRIQSDELKAQVTGDVRLNQNIDNSYLNAKVHLSLSQELRKKLGPLASFLPGKNKEDIRLHIKGNLNNLSFKPI